MSRCVWHLLILLSLTVFVEPAAATNRGPCDGRHSVPPLATKAKIHIVSALTGQVFPFNAEVALSNEDTSRGLKYRTALSAGSGMLFKFDPPREISFWMKDTCVSLDMLFVRKDGSIIKIADSAKPQDLTPVPSEGSVAYVLEIKGGTARRKGIKVGDRLIIK